MSDGALFNLVRVDTIEDEAPYQYGYSAGAGVGDDRDEIELVDTNGEPAATIGGVDESDLDYNYRYADGGRSEAPRLIEQKISLNIDYIGDATMLRLKQWRQQRARIYFTPGFGRDTRLAWRPIAGIGTLDRSSNTLYDLTGRHAVQSVFDVDTLVWDHARRFFRTSTAANDRRFILTPGGIGQASCGVVRNRWDPSYPKSATAGWTGSTAGWQKGGSDSADITFTYNATGFGHPLCPGSLLVTTNDDTSSDRFIYYQGYSPSTGTGTLTAVVWLRGRVGYGDKRIVLTGGYLGAPTYSIDLSEVDITDWTPIVLQIYEDGTFGDGDPLVRIYMQADSYGDRSEIEIGPVAMYHEEGSPTYVPFAPIWRDASDGAMSATESISFSSVTMPLNGSIVGSIYIPAGYTSPERYHRYGITGGSARYMRIIKSGTVSRLTYTYDATNNIGGTVILTEGLHSFAFTWGTDSKLLYWDGQLIATAGDDEHDMSGVASATLYLGRGSQSYDGIYPGALLSYRMDAVQHDANKISMLHDQLTDAGAIAVIAAARGRIYKIDSLPDVRRITARGTHWLGELVLQQVGYEHDFVDLMTQEVD